MAQILRKERFRKGAIAFERDEVRFRLDDKGRPIGVYTKVQKEANQLIEEFMLLANRRVAEFCAHRMVNGRCFSTRCSQRLCDVLCSCRW